MVPEMKYSRIINADAEGAGSVTIYTPAGVVPQMNSGSFASMAGRTSAVCNVIAVPARLFYSFFMIFLPLYIRHDTLSSGAFPELAPSPMMTSANKTPASMVPEKPERKRTWIPCPTPLDFLWRVSIKYLHLNFHRK
jgi:hypothetical protein